MTKANLRVDGLEKPGIRTVSVDFPSNSKNDRNETDKPEKKVERVTTGKVIERKKSLGKKFSETFFGGDSINTVIGYVFNDVLLPAAKSTISDMVSSGIEMLLFGTTSGKRSRGGSSSGGRTSYGNYYKADGSRTDAMGRKPISSQNRARHNFDDIILETRGEAEEVLSNLVDLVRDYEVASVADLYDLVDITSNFTDNKWGWEDLRGASVSRVREGYLLNLPKVKELK